MNRLSFGKFHNLYPGISMIELMLAMALFLIISVSGMSAIVSSFSTNRVGNEHTEARLVAQEGIEAVRSMKNAGWDNMENGTYGLDSSSGSWAFSGTSDTVDDRYTREIIISDVYRDIDGNIVESEGEIDPSAKLVTSLVTWSYTEAKLKTVELTTYLTQWDKSARVSGDAILVYADYSGEDDTIMYRTLSSNYVWSEAQPLPDLGVPSNRNTRRLDLYSSTVRDEKVLLTKHTEDGQFLYAQVWNGSEWGNVIQLTGYGDNTNPNTRNFDGAYMGNGDFMVVYDDFTYVPKYRIWNGIEWLSEASVGDIDGYPVWITARSVPNTNNVMVVVRDHRYDTNAIYWNGSSWDSPQQLGSNSGWGTFSLETYSFEWSQDGANVGGLLYAQASGWFSSKPNFRVYKQDTGWSGDFDIGVGGDPLIVQVVSRPNTSEFLGCMRDDKNHINCVTGNESGNLSSISNGEIADITDSGDQRSFALGYESQSGELALVVYAEGGSEGDRRVPKYRTYNPVSDTFSDQRSLPALGDNPENALHTVRIVPSPVNDDIMVLMADDDESVYSIIWDGDNSDFYDVEGSGLTLHTNTGPVDYPEDFWYEFVWD